MTAGPLSLFEAVGIEIETAIVDADSLDVRSVADEVLREAGGTGEFVEDVDDGDIGWSNELVTHVLELKTNGPAPSFEGLTARFVRSLQRLGSLAEEGWSARLMPTGMHPWMDPAAETRLWPHDHGPVYSAYDRMFDCRRHGWANVQSVHLNLPFADEHEFARLMAACRLVLPWVPAIAAGSPIVEGRATGLLDNRLDYYRSNSARVPSMAGDVIPEPIFGAEEYREHVLGAIARELEAEGADAALLGGHEWTNARGAIARFDRMAIEIRLIDAQECSASDLAVSAAVAGLVRGLVEERWAPLAAQQAFPSKPLLDLLVDAIARGPDARITSRSFAELFGLPPAKSATMRDGWRHLAERSFGGPPELEPALQTVLARGTLAERILHRLGPGFERDGLRAVYRELCGCLAEGRPFTP